MATLPPFHDKEGKRIYIKDHSKDPLWNLVKALFPSPAGFLNTATTATGNFGKHIKSPQVIALLLEYAHALRNSTGSVRDPGTVKQEIREKFIHKISGRDETRKSGRVINGILECINASITQENENGFYPKYITEQVILAFFCERFDAQADIWSLLSYLPDKIVPNKKALPKEEGLLAINDLDLIQNKFVNDTNPVTCDDFYNLANAEIFYNPVPYKIGTCLLGNGLARAHSRKTDKEISNKYFADCIEISMRHLINLITYDAGKQRFNLEHVNKYVQQKNPDNPFFNNFLEFYENQTPDMVNAGGVEIRSLWNRVVGDLNAYDQDNADKRIVYIKNYTTTTGRAPEYEIKTGLINFINVFRKLFNLELEDNDKNNDLKLLERSGLFVPGGQLKDDQQRRWVVAYLEALLNALNPDRVYAVEPVGLYRYTHGSFLDIFGEIKILVVKNNSNQDFLFSFSLSLFPGHGKIINLVVPKRTIHLTEFFERIYPEGYKGNILLKDSLALLGGDLANKIYHPLYRLFVQPLEDNESRISLLQAVAGNYQDWKSQNILNEPLVSSIISHVLRALSWDDEHTLHKVSPLILQLKNLGLVSQNEVKGLGLPQTTGKELQSIIEKYPNLEYLSLSNTKDLEVISLANLSNLKGVNLGGSSVKEIMGLENLTALERLDLSNTKNLEAISLNNLPNLKELDLRDSSITKVDLQNLAALGQLDLYNAKNLETISLDNLPSLEYLILSYFPVSEVALQNLVSLKLLNLSDTNSLKAISLANLPNLQWILLERSSVGTEKIIGLDNLGNVEIMR